MVEAQSKPRKAETSKRDADDPRDSLVVRFGADKPLKLDSGVSLAPVGPDRAVLPLPRFHNVSSHPWIQPLSPHTGHCQAM